jgi:carbon storage regulator
MDPDRATDRPGADGSVGRSAARDRSRPGFLEVRVLILSRKTTQSVVIPSHRIEIVVVDIVGDKVRLGFKAPDDVDIYRDEVWKDMCFEDWNQRSNHDGAED